MNDFPLVVLDASAALALLLAEKTGDEVETLIRNTLIQNGQIFVPELFWFEIGNSLLSAERKNRITELQSTDAFSALADLPFVSHAATDSAVRSRIFDLSRLHVLTYYDAAYLELALRFGARLMSFDRHIRALRETYPLIL